MNAAGEGLGWGGIARLALVQAALGAIVVLMTSTLNRVMVVELALPAVVPGLLVAIHHAVQMLRPRFGHGSDVGGRRTRWIVGGMAVLALGGTGAAAATALIGTDPAAGLALALVAYSAIGLGIGAAGTSLLVLVAEHVAPERRAPAATMMWMTMIVSFALTTAIVGRLLDPFTPARLVAITAAVSLIAFLVAVAAVAGVEPGRPSFARTAGPAASFRAALREVWGDGAARRFTAFVFVSMLAYSAQDLILEPFAGLVFGLTPGGSTRLASLQHGATVLGMVAVALAGSRLAAGRLGTVRAWMIGGCLVSAVALGGLTAAGVLGAERALRPLVFLLGVANGAFAVAAISSMMELANLRHDGRAGVRIGLWGASQAIAFAIGGVLGAAAVDLARTVLEQPAAAYGLVFAVEAALFVASARMALTLDRPTAGRAPARGALALVPARSAAEGSSR